MLKRPWIYGAVIGAGALLGYLVYDGKPMCIGCYYGDILAYAEFLLSGRNWLIRSDVIDIRTPIIGILLGAFIAAYLKGEFRFRKGNAQVFVLSVTGGFLAGFGTFLAGGCSFRHIIVGIPVFLANSWIAAAGIVLGVYAGLLLVGRFFR